MSQQFASNDPRLAEPAFRAFTNIAKAWALTDLEQSKILGQSVDDAFAVLVTGIVGDRWPNTLERVSYVIGIYTALHSVFRWQPRGVRRFATDSPMPARHLSLARTDHGPL